jgi:proline iminopeptidase
MTVLPIPPPRASGFTTRTASPLYWARWGQPHAPELLVLHGGPGAHHDYLLPQMLDLADTYDMVFYDQRGGGRSKTDGRDVITWRTQVDDLAFVANELVDRRFGLVGYSWGGLLAMLYVITAQRESRPDVWPLPSSMVLIAPAGVASRHRRAFEAAFQARQNAAWVQKERDALAASGLRERDVEAHRQRAFELSVAGYFAHPEQATSLTPFRVTSRVQQSVWESLGDYDITADLRDIVIPTLILHGTADPIPMESSRSAAAALDAQLVELQDCGHVPYVECPHPLFSSMRSFLQHTLSERQVQS